MGYFPFFVELKDTPGLIVGAGRVGLHKIKKLIDYGPQLTVVAKEFDSRVKEMASQGLIADQTQLKSKDFMEDKKYGIMIFGAFSAMGILLSLGLLLKKREGRK